MQPKIKFGLIAGAIGLVLNVCVAAVMGICGPAVSLVAGALAGFFAAREEKAPSQGEGAKSGAISGAIAGALVLIGQILGGIAILLYNNYAEAIYVPSDTASQIGYWVGGLGAAFCFGIIGIGLAAGVGAGTGYLGTPSSSSPKPPFEPPQYIPPSG